MSRNTIRLTKPIHITFVGSLILGALVLIALFIVEKYAEIYISFLTILFTTLLTIVLSFLIFTYLIGRFINSKIKFIYGIITNRQTAEEADYGIAEDVLTRLTKDTAEWASLQKRQINQLQKQAEFRKEFLGNLAHELKTPVFSIQGYILTLLEGGLEDERVNRDFLVRALSGVDRISNLLEDLDNIAKFETDRFELKIQKFDLVKLTNDIFRELEKKAKKKKIKLSFDEHYEPLHVSADKNRITQVLVNLISNSISYGKEEGQTTVSFDVIDKKKVLIQIADNGVGMAPEHIPRLFERFYRVDKSRERNVGGSGLGLAIVKHIIEAHKQTINVKSTEGIGSTFSFTLEKV